MNLIVPHGMEVVVAPELGLSSVVIDTGLGRVWRLDAAFSGRGLYVTNAPQSIGDVMNVFPRKINAVQLVQYPIGETEPYEDRIEELEEAAREALGAMIGDNASDDSVQGKARDKLRAALGVSER